jgi:hypothetical protein
MKSKLVLGLLVVFTTTGCAQVGQIMADQFKSSEELAIESCQRIGYQPGNETFRQCVITQANSIRQARAAQAASSERVRESMRSTHTNCWSNGVHVSCQSSRY